MIQMARVPVNLMGEYTVCGFSDLGSSLRMIVAAGE
jgi:hypothetical protein